MNFKTTTRLLLVCSLAPLGPAQAYTLKRTDAGRTVRWETGSVGYRVSSAGARDVSADKARAAIADAFSAWTSLPGVALDLEDAGLTDRPVGFDPHGQNENVVAFSRDAWPFEPDALAMTVTAYQERSGQLVDADILVNEADYVWGVGKDAENDLVNALTHEVGHFVGLGHSEDPEATMFARAQPFEMEKRTLGRDDMAAVALLYPGQRAAGNPAGGAAPAAEAPETAVETPAAAVTPQAPRVKIRTGCSQAPGRSPEGFGLLAALLALRAGRRNRRSPVAGAALALGACLAVGTTLWPCAASATIAPAMTLAELTDRATDIVEGTVVELHPRWTEGFLVTDVTVDVSRCLKGSCDAEIVEIQVFGGVADGFVVEAAGAARYAPGEAVLVFLEPIVTSGPARFRTPGLSQGKFRLALAGDMPAAERHLEGLELVGPGRVLAEGENEWSREALELRIDALLRR